MKIPSYQKIDAQVSAYAKRHIPDITVMYPEYTDLENEISKLDKKHMSHIREECDRKREHDDRKPCTCKNHPDYNKYVELIEPLVQKRDVMHREYRKMRDKMVRDYTNLLSRAKHAKEEYCKTH